MGKEGGSLGDKMKALAPALAGVAAGFLSFKVIEGAIEKTQELGEATLKLQQQTGMTAKSSSELISVFEHFGLSTDSAGKSLGIFAKNLTVSYEQTLGFSSSASTFTKTMDSLGVATLDTSNKMRPLQDVLLDVADKFHGMPDEAEKAGVAVQIFGKSGRDLIPILDQGSTGIKELEAEADKLGVTLTEKNVTAIHEYTTSQREMNEAVNGMKLQIGLELMPVLTDFADWFVKNAPSIEKFFQQVLDEVKNFTTNGVAGLKEMSKALQWIPDNKGMVILAVVAIGAAIYTAFGPASIAFIALAGIVSLLGKITRGSEGAAKLPDLYQQQDALQKQLQQEGVPSGGGQGYVGLPPISGYIEPGSQADKSEKAKTSDTQKKLDDVNAQIAHFEDVESNAGKAAEDAAPPIASVSDGLSALPPAAAKAKKSAEELAKEVDDAMKSVKDSIDSALDDSNISYSELKDINKNIAEQNKKLALDHLDQITALTVHDAAALEATQALAANQSKSDEMTFNLTKTMEKFNLVLKDSKQAADQLTSALSRQALTALQAAASSLFQNPTKEQATLNLQLAEAQDQIANFSAAGATDDMLAKQNALVAGIQKQIAVESARVALDQAQLDVADQTKLTDQQQQDAVKGLIPLIRDQSTALQNNTQYLSDFGTLMVQAAQAVALFKSVVGNDATTFNDNVVQIIRQTALTGGFNGILVTPQQTGQ